MTHILEATLEYILAKWKTGTGAYPSTNRLPEVILEDLADDLAATATHPGIVELATDAEAIAGTDTARAITPANLAAAVTGGVTVPDASATVKGKVELATNTETVAVTDQARAVTPYGLGAALAKLFVISFAGAAAAGPCTATGVAVGDVIFSVSGLSAADLGEVSAKFEGAVTVINQIQQSDVGNLSANNYLALVYHPA